jgi:hypothetical protein
MLNLPGRASRAVVAVAETVYLHRIRGAEFLSPTATEPGIGAMIQFDR